LSEAKMISPMLDNFVMGSAMSEHHGVRCYPAIENETGDKYIVKVISIPSSPTQVDALLLTGAYSDRASAVNYFKQIADDLVQEVDVLEKLAELEGFLSFRACQIVPMDSGEGFDIYLLSPYQRTLQKHFTRHAFTHLDALNLGLDLCAALSVARRNGYLYIDLKPGNVYITDQRLFRIGDLGFVRMDALQYSSMPEKYLSTYTPPEIRDAFSTLNTTIDIYAVGLILYQTYNNGELPFHDSIQPGDKLPAPLYADYEMSEIILKACDPNPDARWQDPMEMGQAIVSYMQRNGALDTPIVPAPEPVTETPAVEELVVEEAVTEEPVAEAVIAPEPAAAPVIENIVVEEPATDPVVEEIIVEEPVAEKPVVEEMIVEEPAKAPVAEELIVEEPAKTPVVEELIVEEPAIILAVSEELEEEYDEEIVLEEGNYENLTDETSEILNQADELATIPVPQPVVAPEYVEVPIPEPVIPQEEKNVEELVVEELDVEELDVEEPIVLEEAAQAEGTEEADLQWVGDDEPAENETKKSHRVRNIILVTVFLIALIAGGFLFVRKFYVSPIEIVSVEGNMDTLTVHVKTDIAEDKLTVICLDTYGNKITAPVNNGKAEFTGLVPNTAYRIEVTASGLHRLSGTPSTAYSTPIQTNIVQFDAVTGATEDSVIIRFTAEGPTCNEWTILYSAEGEAERSATFTSHTVTLTNLTVGKDYTFRLVPGEDLYVTGMDTLQFTTRPLIKAENLQITGCHNNALSVKWDCPAGEPVSNWSVHCFNDSFNQTIITSETSAVFTGLDHTAEYTVEVKAAGMSEGVTTQIDANSITAIGFTADTSDPTKITFQWESSHPIPEDGWLLQYRIHGIENEITIPCASNTATIYPVVPNATYEVHVQDIKGNILLGSKVNIVTKAPVDFAIQFGSFQGTREDLVFTICRTPKNPNWGRLDLNAGDYTSDFAAGENASYLVKFPGVHSEPDEEVIISYVIRNQEGTPIQHSVQSHNWSKMWPVTNCKLNVPSIPTVAGTYTMEVYFDGQLAHEQTFTIH